MRKAESEAAGSPRVDVRRRNAPAGADTRAVGRRATKIMLALGLRDAELSVLLCGDCFIRSLNAEYRGIDRATDVLSFPLADEPGLLGPAPMLGDVVISIDTAARQASARGATLMDEVTSLLIHGVLHLIGHDHGTDAEEARMNAESERIARSIEGAGKSRNTPLTSPKNSTKKRTPRRHPG